MEKLLAERTLDRAAAAMRQESVACLPEIVKLMRTLSRNTSAVSVPELAEVVQKDAVILAKVIGAANTLGYNPGAIPVTTVTQAIHVIGYERIRSLAMSLLLVEQTNRGKNADEQREVAALALTSGCIAQAAAESRLLLNPEEAFVCASLRNFGRIVMVTCMLDEYREAQQLANAHASDDAFRQIFGLTPLELGHRLLEASDLPEDLLLALRTVSPEVLAALSTDPSSQMLALTDFSAQLAEIALKPDLSAAGFAAQTEALAARYATVLPGLATETMPLIESATKQLHHFVQTLRIKSLPTRSLVRLKQRAAAIDPAGSMIAPASVAGSGAPTAANVVRPAVAAGPAVAPAFSWQVEIDRVAALTNSGVTRDRLFAAVIDSVRRGLEASECLLFLGAPGSSECRLVHGTGTSFSGLGEQACVRRSERNVFGVCLARGENILIHDAADPKIAPYLPGWLPSRRVLGAFVLLPIVAGQQTHGLILAGWPDTRQIVVSPDNVRLIRVLLGALCPASERCAA